MPLSAFQPNAAMSPDFDRLSLADHGHTICFGEYKASVGSALRAAFHDIEQGTE